MGFFDHLLGPDRGPGLLSSVKGTKPPAIVEATKSQLSQALYRELHAAPAPAPINEGSPFTELYVPFRSVPGPQTSGLSTSVPQSVQTVQGDRLLLRRAGTPPDARFLVSIGGELHLFTPGHEVVAKFSSFTLVRRLFFIGQDIGGTGMGASAFQGEAAFFVARNGAELREPQQEELPFFRSPNLLGTMLPSGSTFVAWASGDSYILARSGARRLRFTFQRQTIADGDTLTVAGYTSPVLYNAAFEAENVGALALSRLSGPAFSLTWEAGVTYHQVELDVSNAPELLAFKLTVSDAAHGAGVVVQGIP